LTLATGKSLESSQFLGTNFAYLGHMKIDQDIIAELLENKLRQMKENNPMYSLRSMAMKVKVSPSTLSQIINKKRTISKELAIKIVNSLSFSEPEKIKFLEPFNLNEQMQQEVTYDNFDHHLFHPEDNWAVFAILNLIEIEDFLLSPTTITKAIGITNEKATELLEKLIRQKLITWDANGKAIRTSERMQTADGSSDRSLKIMHEKNLELAKKSLDKDDVDQRDFTSMTFAINPDQLPKAKELIRKFEDDLATFLLYGKQKQVYKLNIQLFPLSEDTNEEPRQ
jgi:uncharacterized protein (TIGR02147 family)